MQNIDQNEKRKKPLVKAQQTVPAFVLKTYEILENQQFSHIISWNPCGTSFTIKNVQKFTEQVLPMYFKHKNYFSFVRQLNLYDFHKTRNTLNNHNLNEFKHKLFIQGKKELLKDIKRKINDQMENNFQIQNYNSVSFLKDFDIFQQQMQQIRSRLDNLEQTSDFIINQNAQIIKDHKYLLSEMVKNKDRQDQKIEHLTILIFTIMSQKQFPQNYSQNALKQIDQKNDQPENQQEQISQDFLKNLKMNYQYYTQNDDQNFSLQLFDQKKQKQFLNILNNPESQGNEIFTQFKKRKYEELPQNNFLTSQNSKKIKTEYIEDDNSLYHDYKIFDDNYQLPQIMPLIPKPSKKNSLSDYDIQDNNNILMMSPTSDKLDINSNIFLSRRNSNIDINENPKFMYSNSNLFEN